MKGNEKQIYKCSKNELRRLDRLHELLLDADFKVLDRILNQNNKGGE